MLFLLLAVLVSTVSYYSGVFIMEKLRDYETLWQASRHSCLTPIVHRSLVITFTERGNDQQLDELVKSAKNDEDLLSRQDSRGRHALNIAVKNKDVKCAEILLKGKARIEPDSSMGHPLDVAVDLKATDLTKLLYSSSTSTPKSSF